MSIFGPTYAAGIQLFKNNNCNTMHGFNGFVDVTHRSRTCVWGCLVMDTACAHLMLFCSSQLTGRLDDICINRAATQHNFPAWNSRRMGVRLINSGEHYEFKSAYLLFRRRSSVFSRQAVGCVAIVRGNTLFSV